MLESSPREESFAVAYQAIAGRAAVRGAAAHQRELLAGLHGTVCEVGVGPGLTFALYPPEVTRVIAVEPNAALRRAAVRSATRSARDVEVVDGVAARLPLPDTSCDAVVFSLVLCSVPSVATALREAARVLRPDGQLRCYEHVRSRYPMLGRAEDLVAPLWARLAGGCHPNRDPVAACDEAGFTQVQSRRFVFGPVTVIPAFAHVIVRAHPPRVPPSTYRAPSS